MDKTGEFIIKEKGYADTNVDLHKDTIISIRKKTKQHMVEIYIGTISDFLDDIDFNNIAKRIERRWEWNN